MLEVLVTYFTVLILNPLLPRPLNWNLPFLERVPNLVEPKLSPG